MYQEFATADVDSQHVVISAEDADTLAVRLHHLVQAGSLRRPTVPTS